MSRKQSTYVAFLDNNEELANEYENVLGEDLWSLPSGEIEKTIRTLASKLKVGFNSVLNNCINFAIQTETSLISVVSNFDSSGTTEYTADTSVQQYFNEIKRIYEKNNNDFDIEFKPENRDKIISMNLKTVIAVAKCYQGLGVDFQDLISAGNEGLCKAFDKYDPKRACLKDDIVNAVNELDDVITYKELSDIINHYLTYGEKVKNEFNKKFHEGSIYCKDFVIKWIDKNIRNAKFNSVAFKWIKAYIIGEINNNSRVVKKPKSEIDKDKLETGSYKKEMLVNIDAPFGNDDNAKSAGDFLSAEDNTIEKDSLENEENYKVFKQALNVLLTGVKSRDRRIVLKKFGIGTIRPLQPNEIAVQEDLSVARVSQIINTTLDTMVANSKKYNIDKKTLFEAIEKLV